MKYLGFVLLLILLSNSLAQGKAWRDIQFGDSPDVIGQKLRAYDDVTVGWLCSEAVVGINPPQTTNLVSDDIMKKCMQNSLYEGFHTKIGSSEFTINFEFYDSKLFRVKFRGASWPADMLDGTVKADRDMLAAIITQARGAPNYAKDLTILGIDPEYYNWTHMWDTNSEGVATFIGLSSYDFKYYPVMWAEWTYLRELYDQNNQGEQDQVIQNESDDF